MYLQLAIVVSDGWMMTFIWNQRKIYQESQTRIIPFFCSNNIVYSYLLFSMIFNFISLDERHEIDQRFFPYLKNLFIKFLIVQKFFFSIERISRIVFGSNVSFLIISGTGISGNFLFPAHRWLRLMSNISFHAWSVNYFKIQILSKNFGKKNVILINFKKMI